MGIPQEKTVMGIPQEKTVMGIPQSIRAGEDHDGDSPGEDRDGDFPGEDRDGDSPKYSSSEEARDERRRIGEGESSEVNRRRCPVRSLEVNRLRERSSEMPRS